MFEPIRGGTRGGQAEFKWADVSADKDRENYLGHSINAPTGRWQKNKDIHWYNRDLDQGAAEKAEEIRKIKELEAEALSAALGFEPAKPGSKSTSSGANAVPVASTSAPKYAPTDTPAPADTEKERRKQEKEERRRIKAAHKEAKRARRALKEMSRSGAHEVRDLEERSYRSKERDSDRDEDEGRDRYRNQNRELYRGRSSRSRSPRRRARSRSRSRTPPRPATGYGRGDTRRDNDITPPPRGEEDRAYPDKVSERRRRNDAAYDEQERESERERDRMRWERNASRRELPQDRDRERRRW